MKRSARVLASLCLVCACGVAVLLPATASARMATGVGGWSWQNPLPQGNGYTGGYFLDASHGWLISRGTIFHTADGGVTLTVQARHNVRFSAITFVGAKHGWAVGPPTSGGADVLYRTVDGGRTWTRVPLQWSGGINGVSFATTEVGWATLVHSILRSTDGGLHWTRYALTKHDRTRGVQALSSLRAWVADGDTLLRTVDGGATWKRVPAGGATNLNVVCFTSPESGWAGGGSYRGAGQIVHTTDGGLHWSAQLASQGVSAISFADSSNGWATAGGAAYRTTDGGTDWVPQATAPYATWVLALTPLGAIVGNDSSSVGLSHTSDGGVTWQSSTVAAGDYFGRLNGLQFVNTEDGWAVGSGGGILATTNGGATWGAQDSTITADLNRVHFIDATAGWAVGDQGTIVNTTDGGATWTAQTSGVGYDLTGVTFSDAQNGWATGQSFSEDNYSSGVTLHTTDGGQDWMTQYASIFDPSKDIPGVAFGAVAFADAEHGWAVGETQGSDSGYNLTVIMHTADGGATWKRQLDYMPPFVSNEDDATLSGIACTDRTHAVAVGYDEDYTEIWRTTNGGQTWTRVGQKLWPLYSTVDLADVVFADASHGWAVGTNGNGDAVIIHTTDGGATWTKQLVPNYIVAGPLDALSFVSPKRGWVAGGNAAILATTTGGIAP